MINTPPLQSALTIRDGVATWTQPWSNWMTASWQILFASQQFGPTAERPAVNLWVGRPYFDTSLGAKGKPIWVGKDGATWVLADGTVA